MDSDDEDCTNMNVVLLTQNRHRRKRVCIKNYECHFRVTRSTFENLLETFGPLMANKNENGTGRPAHEVTKQLLIVIWILANQESYRSVADRFDVAKATCWEYVHKITKILVEQVSMYIKYPNRYQATETIRGFKERHNFDGIIGAIYGSHIPIVAPTIMPNGYVNRKKYHSLILQGVCNHKYMFTDCFAGVPGSVHDARVLRMSPLGKALNEENNLFPMNSHLIGDSAYPNNASLLVPYRDNGYLSLKQKNYNHKQSSSRVYIEQTFGLLKGRFRILQYVNIYRTDLIPNIIIACCILHNICMEIGDTEVDCDMDDSLPQPPTESIDVQDNDGRKKRGRLANELFN